MLIANDGLVAGAFDSRCYVLPPLQESQKWGVGGGGHWKALCI